MKEKSIELWRVLTYMAHGTAASMLLAKAERGMKHAESGGDLEGLREERGKLTPSALNSCTVIWLMLHGHT